MQIRGLVNLITGGCSGLGLATARHLISLGGKVVMLDINEKAGVECVKELGSKECHFIPCDVSDQEQVKKSFNEANKVFGPVRVYLNSAAIVFYEKILKDTGIHDTNIFLKTIKTNLLGSFLCTKYAAWHLKDLPLLETERGIIINVSSVDAKFGSAGIAAYSASKGGLEGMLLPIARELGPHNIRFLNISPGHILTPMSSLFPQEALDLVASLTVRGKSGKPEHFAQLVEAIIKNSYLNATTLKIDDGLVIPKL